MKILVVGGGGREHAITWALNKSPKCEKLYCAPGNAGIAEIAQCCPVSVDDIPAMVALAKELEVRFVFVAPDNPLADGLVDALLAEGISAVGPTAKAARVESSKKFAKELMRKYNIPTARYQSFDQMDKALAYIRKQGAPIVVKADGLALGKGVVVAQSVEEAQNAVCSMMGEGVFKEAGRRVVIEECLTGPEVTVLAFTDGKTVLTMPSSQDHKRVGEGNTGLNTGGMGAISPSPFFTAELAQRCMDEIFLPTVKALQSEGCPFKGVLYFGLMLTPDGPRVIEYNARFGDPEAQTVLPLLETDLVDICIAIMDEKLSDIEIKWKQKASCSISLCSGGYPGQYKTGLPITGLESCHETTRIFHAGTKKNGQGQLVTAGGRVLSVVAQGDSLNEAIESAYMSAKGIDFEGIYYRRDIGRANG